MIKNIALYYIYIYILFVFPFSYLPYLWLLLGCAFLTFVSLASATKCMETLHDKHTVDGVNHTIQIKPANADGQKVAIAVSASDSDRKLFVGMISKSLNEDQV